MTILFLTRLFYPHIGGVEKHVLEVSKRLVTKGHKVIVITEEFSNLHHSIIDVIPAKAGIQKENIRSPWIPDQVRNDKINGIEVIRMPVGHEDSFKKFRIWKNLWKIRKVIKDADIVHCHDVFFWYMPFRLLYPRKPVYTTFHGYESYPITKKAIFTRKISEKLSSGNICIGDFIKKWYGTHPTFVSYGAVDIKALPLIRGSRRGFIKHSALFYGRLDAQTGILTYNEAFKLLRKKYPKFEFLIVGDGPDKNLLDKKAKAIGFQKNPEKYFKNYRFAFVSRYLSILEAMAAKRLVFAVYDNPIKEDYLRMAPFAKFIFIKNDAKRLANQVEKIINNPKLEREMIESAYEWVKKQTWEEMTKIYTTLWEKYYNEKYK